MQYDTRGLKVLVAENDRTVLELLQIRLDVAGYHVSAARTGRGALELIKAARPAAMLLELNLPEGDGFEVLQALRAAGGPPPFPILVTGRKLGAEDIRRAVMLGARDCLIKPFSGADVLERISRLLRRPTTPGAKKVVYV